MVYVLAFVFGLFVGMFLISWGMAVLGQTKDYKMVDGSPHWVERKKDEVIHSNDLLVIVDGEIYTEDAGTLTFGPEKPDGKVIAIIHSK
jgi:hypothetical protein